VACRGKRWNGMIYFSLIASGRGDGPGRKERLPIGPVDLICHPSALSLRPYQRASCRPGAAMGDESSLPPSWASALTWVAHLIEGYAAIIELIGEAPFCLVAVSTFMPADGLRCWMERPRTGRRPTCSGPCLDFALTFTNSRHLLAFTAMFAAGGLAVGEGSYVDAGFVVF